MTTTTQTGITFERALRLLEDLVAIDSINPMDGPFTGTRPVEAEVHDYLVEFFAPYDVEVERETFSSRHENLYVTLPGAREAAPTLFEAHADTVPADDWAERALVPHRVGGRVVARGAADTKGSLVAMILAVADLLERGVTPPVPVVVMSAGDEEYAQTGIKHFRQLGRPVGRGIFGEPSDLAPIVQHKGTIRWDITVHGKSAHTSRPHNGVNAIHGAIDVVAALARHQDQLQGSHSSDLMTGPTLTVTMIHGGRTRNAVPDECTVSVDYRVVPGQVPEDAREGVVEALRALPHEVTHGDVQLMTPPLATSPDDGFARQVLDVCRRHTSPDTRLAGVPYGTDASWVSDVAPALVLGPGSIDTAHAVDEWVEVADVVTCAEIYRDIMLADPTGR